jgi:LysR family hydrogen peroxide-inducible transcriptional activator
LGSGQLDLALVCLPLPSDRLEKRLLFQEDLLLAVPSKHPLAVKEQGSFSDLENERFILMKDGHRLGDQILSFCNRNDLRLQVVLRSSQIETIQSLVMAGLGVSLVPEMSKISGRIPIVYRSLENPRPTRTIVAVWRKERPLSRAAAEFLKHSEQVAKAFPRPCRNNQHPCPLS